MIELIKKKDDLYVSTLELVKGDTGPQGPKGEDGYTPIKGVDYFDGKDGERGPQGEIGPVGPQGEAGKDGKDYVLTADDKAEIAQLALAAMPAAEDGEY